jgi:alanine racemase
MTLTRRSLLAAGLGVPALLRTARGERMPSEDLLSRFDPLPAPDSSLDPWVELAPDHLHHNVMEISRRVASRPILAVIKNNGYGMGVAQVARFLEPERAIAGFAVVKLHEAVTLRDAGIRKPVLLLGAVTEAEVPDTVARGIMPMVYTPLGPVLDRIAAQRQQRIPIHICVDTGLGRVGIPYRDAPPLIRDLASRRSVELRGTMMTFTEDATLDPEQIQRFQSVCTPLESAGLALGAKHAASSFGLFQRPDAFFDMVRPGMAIYGVYSENEFRHSGVMDLRPALSLKARVIFVKKLRQGDTAGYNVAFTAPRDTWVATVPVGHADGWPREAAKGARVRINGQLYPIVAAVSASHCIIDLGTEEPRVRAGDIVTLFDWQEGSRPEDVSEACGVSVYDLTMHLNPLLPRRIV